MGRPIERGVQLSTVGIVFLLLFSELSTGFLEDLYVNLIVENKRS